MWLFDSGGVTVPRLLLIVFLCWSLDIWVWGNFRCQFLSWYLYCKNECFFPLFLFYFWYSVLTVCGFHDWWVLRSSRVFLLEFWLPVDLCSFECCITSGVLGTGMASGVPGNGVTSDLAGGIWCFRFWHGLWCSGYWCGLWDSRCSGRAMIGLLGSAY